MYRLVFDVTQGGLTILWFPLLGLLGIAGSAVVILLRKYLWPRSLAFILVVVPIVIVLWTVTVSVMTIGSYVRLASALRNGRCKYVEGPITEFVPMPPSGHGWEVFKVGGVSFRYSKYDITPGFRQVRVDGSPLYQGAWVKVWYIDNEIARLELKDLK
jgi:hypothetical protein